MGEYRAWPARAYIHSLELALPVALEGVGKVSPSIFQLFPLAVEFEDRWRSKAGGRCRSPEAFHGAQWYSLMSAILRRKKSENVQQVSSAASTWTQTELTPFCTAHYVWALFLLRWAAHTYIFRVWLCIFCRRRAYIDNCWYSWSPPYTPKGGHSGMEVRP